MVFQWRKWDGSPHWRHECVYLGADEWGDWVGQPVGWHSFRPGAELYAAASNVTLVPPSGDFALTVNRDHPIGMRIYIDLGWEVRWTDDPLHPEQRISREQAIRLYTINNAWLTFEEKQKGSLEPGKLADLVVLQQDILTCPVDEVKDIQVHETWLGGKVVYSAGESP